MTLADTETLYVDSLVLTSQKSACFCLTGAGIASVSHHAQLFLFYIKVLLSVFYLLGHFLIHLSFSDQIIFTST